MCAFLFRHATVTPDSLPTSDGEIGEMEGTLSLLGRLGERLA